MRKGANIMNASRLFCAAAFASGLLTAYPVLAEANPSAVVSFGKALTPTAQESKDNKVLVKAMTSYLRNGFKSLTPHVEKLNAALANAPAAYPKVETRGPEVIVRMSPEDGMVTLIDAATTFGTEDGPSVVLRLALNVYPTISWLLGGYEIDRKQPQAALAVLEKGLALQPNTVMLICEKGAALQMLDRSGEALALYDARLALNKADPLSRQERAHLERGRGDALTKLGRLEDANAAYKTAKEVDPPEKR